MHFLVQLLSLSKSNFAAELKKRKSEFCSTVCDLATALTTNFEILLIEVCFFSQSISQDNEISKELYEVMHLCG